MNYSQLTELGITVTVTADVIFRSSKNLFLKRLYLST